MMFALILSVSLAFGCGDSSPSSSNQTGGMTTYEVNGQKVNCPKNTLYDGNSPICRVGSITNRTTVTPKGAKVWIENGATVSAEDLTAIDLGLTRAFSKSACKGWANDLALTHAAYTVAVLNASDRDSQGNPAYRVGCAQYCGSEYDKGGYILVAGQMAATGLPYGNIIMIPDPASDRLEYAANGTEYEAEHVILSWFDGDLFEASKTHGGGYGHPIWSCTAGLKSAQRNAGRTPSFKDGGGSLEVVK